MAPSNSLARQLLMVSEKVFDRHPNPHRLLPKSFRFNRAFALKLWRQNSSYVVQWLSSLSCKLSPQLPATCQRLTDKRILVQDRLVLGEQRARGRPIPNTNPSKAGGFYPFQFFFFRSQPGDVFNPKRNEGAKVTSSYELKHSGAFWGSLPS